LDINFVGPLFYALGLLPSRLKSVLLPAFSATLAQMISLVIICIFLFIAAVNCAAPLSLHQVAEVAVGGDVIITMLGYDTDIGHSVS
jgi:hypothetical protein